MSDTDRVVIKLALPEPRPPAAAPEPKRERRWSWRDWTLFVLFVFAVHVGLIFIFGDYRLPKTRELKNVPRFQLAANAGDWMALDDPTLFVLPHARDFNWLRMPDIRPSAFRWTEAPLWLSLPPDRLGAVFSRFMQTNSLDGFALDFKPAPKLIGPVVSSAPEFAGASSMRLDDVLAQRKLPGPMPLPDLPYNDVVKPATVQVVVNVDGNVVSAVLLESSLYKDSDQRSLETARTMRFKPSRHLTVGQVVFHWRTVPLPITSTNTP